jgi:hypothetical protein
MLEVVPVKHMFRYSNLTGSAKAEFRMRTLVNRKEGRRSLGSVTKSLVAVGATSALMLAGLAFVGVSTASAAAATHLVFTTEPTSTTTAGSTLANFQVTVEDSTGAAATVPGASDTIQLTSNCVFTGTTPVTAGTAIATFTGIVITTGTSCTFTATDTLSPDNGFAVTSTTVTVSPTTASKIAYTTGPPTAGVLSVPLTTFKVSVEDTYGNVITTGAGATDSVVLTSGCTLTGTDTVSAAAGVATFSNAYFTAGSSCTLTATDGSFTAGPSGAISLVSNTPTALGFTTEPPATVSAGTVLPTFVVSVEASNGVALQGGVSSADVIVLTSACALTGTTSVTAANDAATFSAVAIKSGSNCQLVATDTSRTLATATSTVVAVTAGTAGQVAFTTAPPTSVTTASTVLTAFRASVEDVNGNVVTSGTGATDTIAITSPCTLGGTTTAVAVAGVATFGALTINVTGACVLTATDASRTLTTATATTTVGTPQAALVLSTVKGTVGKAVNLATTGGTGTGALSYTVAAGSSAGCTVSGTSLSAKRAGTCLVTATKAGSTTYIAVSSAATRVTFVVPFQATRVAGTVTVGRTSTVTIVGSGFSGRPRIICNVAGVTARVTGDTGRTLRVIVTVRVGVKRGVHTFTVILANGKRASVKFSLR